MKNLRTTLALAAALALAAPAARAQQITFWPSSNPQEIEWAKLIVQKWNAANPTMQVKSQPLPASRSTEEVLLASIAAKTTPDVVANINPGVISQFVAAGGLYQHDKFPDFKKYILDRSGQDVLDAYTSGDGHVYQIPWKANPVMFAYNVDLLAQAGVKPADLATYSGFLDAARKVKAKWNGKKYLYSPTVDTTWWQRQLDFYTLYVAASGGKQLLDKKGNVIFDNTPGQQVFEFLATLFKEGLAPKGQTASNRFFDGTTLVEQFGPFTLPFYQQNAPKGFHFDMVPPPVPDNMKGKPVFTYGDPKNIAIFTTSKNPDVAWKFVKFMTSRENDILFLKMTNQVPYREDMLQDPTFAKLVDTNPILERFVKMVPRAVGSDDTPHLVEIFTEISRAYDAAVVHGQGDPKDAIKKAAQKARDIISGFN